MTGQSDQGDLVGITLGQYEIVELIGEGGMATVYKAWQPSLRRYVALKVLAPHLADDAQFVKRFRQEAVSAANLKHTHIVTIHDVGTADGYHYIAMEFIEGTSLEEHIRSGQAFTPEQAVDVISQVGSALDYAHQRGFIHRDIKPANVLIDASGRAVLTDFGIVKALSGSGVTSPLTQAGTIFGTPQYMSPEQVKDEPLDHRSDLYSLGIVCYEMLSGQAPFDGTTTHSILYAQVNNPPPPLREFADLDVPAQVEAVVNKMLAKERDARYGSAGEFARDLAQAVSGVWPAGLGGKTSVVGQMGTGTAKIGGTPPGMPAPTVRQPVGPPTPPATVWQQPGPPTPVPTAAPTRRSRWPMVLGAVAAGVGVLLILAVVGVLAIGPQNALDMLGLKPLETMLAEGQESLAAGRYDEAITTLEDALDKDAENVEALRGIGEAYAAQEQWQQAASWYERWAEVAPDDVEALRKTGEAYEAQERWQQAADWYRKWAQIVPNDVDALRTLGQVYAAQEQWAQAAIWYEKWGQVEPDNPDALQALGRAEYELEHYESAVAQFSRARELAPDRPSILIGQGRAYLALDDYASSLESAEQALELAPDDSPEQGQALELLHDLGEMDPDAAPLLVLSDWYAGRGDEAALQQVNGQILERISYRMEVDLGDQIRFLGSDFHEPSDGQLQVDLYFQPVAPTDTDYTVWIHSYVHEEDISLLPPDRQQYGFIGGGESYPMSRWFEGAIYRDRRVRELAPGEYRFAFGVWLPESEARLGTEDDPETGAVDLGWQLVGLEEPNARILSHRGWRAFESDELEQAREAFGAALAKEPENLDALLGASATYGALGDSARLAEVTDRLLSLIPNQRDLLLGDVMRFIGYEIQTLVDGRAQMDLYFQPIAPMGTDYTVWMHNHVHEEDISLLPPDRRQYGFISGGESYPMSTWVVEAVYRARMLRELASGEYRFIFGVWVPDSAARLGTVDDPGTGAVDLGWHVVGAR